MIFGRLGFCVIRREVVNLPAAADGTPKAPNPNGPVGRVHEQFAASRG